MADSPINLHQLADMVGDQLLTVLNKVDFDIDYDTADQVMDIYTDEWTLHIELDPKPVAWFAVDSEPDDPQQFATLRQSVLGKGVEDALARADEQLNGLIRASLINSGDLFSISLATAMKARAELMRNLG